MASSSSGRFWARRSRCRALPAAAQPRRCRRLSLALPRYQVEGRNQHLQVLQEQLGLMRQMEQPLGSLRLTLQRAWLLSYLQQPTQLLQTPYSLLYRFVSSQ